MRTNTRKFGLALVIGLALFAGLTAVVLAGTFTPSTVTDQTLTAPLANPIPSSYQPRYISGFGSDDSSTVFFEDRDNGNAISYAQTTSGPTGFPASATATNITDTHFVVKDWPINVGGTDYAYRAWGSVGNNLSHHFYVSNNLTNWTLVSTFTIPNAASFTDAHGWVYYGFHDVILLNGTYYAFAESNQSQTMLVRSANGDGVWEAFASIGGRPGWGPLELPAGEVYGWTPSGSFVDLGHDRGYGKIYVDPGDSDFYLAINTAAKPSLPPAELEAAFINPANWTWHDGTTGPASNPILSETSEHDLRECWVVPNSDPDADWVIIYDADFGSADGGKALGYATLSPPLPPPEIVWVDDDYCDGYANDGHTWAYDAFDSIQDGIDAVAGSTVHVAAGTYDESVTVNKSLRLLGAKANVDPRGGAWSGGISTINPGAGNTGIEITAANVTVHGFEITGGQYGILVNPVASDVSNVAIKYNDLHTNSKYGCQLIDLVDGATLSAVNVSTNYVHHNERNGLKMVDVTDCVVDSNEFTHNGFGAGATKPEYKYGIFLEDERYNAPIYSPAINNTFTRNSFHDNNLGAINMEVMGNASGTYWTSTEFLEGTVVQYNNFYGASPIWGINVDNDYEDDGTPNGFGPIATVDATCNWWGDPSGPSGVGSGLGDAVSGAVDFEPWLLAPGPNAPCGGILMASFVIDHAKLDFKKKPDDDKVRVQGRLELDLVSGDNVYISEDVTVTIGPLSETITMVEKGKKGDKWEYKRPKGGTGDIKKMTIDWKNGKFDIRMDKADLTGVTNPVTISIQIGDDVGSESILMREKKHHWDYKVNKPKAVEIEPFGITDELKVVAYPNPIRDVNTATFQVMGTLAAEVEEIRVQIYDLSGHLVWEDAALGSELDWHTDSLSGDYLANGIYLYRVQVRIGGSWINQDIGKIAVLR